MTMIKRRFDRSLLILGLIFLSICFGSECLGQSQKAGDEISAESRNIDLTAKKDKSDKKVNAEDQEPAQKTGRILLNFDNADLY